MTLLLIDIEKLKLNSLIEKDNNYDFMNKLKEYNIPIENYYTYINNINEYKLKNLWNHIIIRWNIMKRELNEELKDNNINYNEIYNQKHKCLTHNNLNELLKNFCNNDLLKLIFTINSIQNYIYPIKISTI